MTLQSWHDAHYQHTTPESHPKRWHPFIEIDPFNPENRLQGHIQLSGGEEYGALLIQEVNGQPAPQLIMVTPKTTYPFFKDGSWILAGVERLDAYLKLDGTNICQFAYQDADDKPFTSFKVRVRPFMAPFFISLMERVLSAYPGVAQKKLQHRECLVYELYGYDNPMLVRYDQPIELTLLFARASDGNIIPLQPHHPIFDGIDCPRAEHRPIDDITDIQAEYLRRQEQFTNSLTPITDDQFDGQEGEMLYATFPAGARTTPGSFIRLIKLKAHQIEEIHWASDHISKLEMQATCRNIFELTDNPTEQDLIQLLAEDWSDSQIQNSIDTLRTVLPQTIEHRQFQERVLHALQQIPGAENFRQNPRAVMRELSQHFSRREMQKVYLALVERGIAEPTRPKHPNSP